MCVCVFAVPKHNVIHAKPELMLCTYKASGYWYQWLCQKTIEQNEMKVPIILNDILRQAALVFS